MEMLLGADGQDHGKQTLCFKSWGGVSNCKAVSGREEVVLLAQLLSSLPSSPGRAEKHTALP